MSIALQRRMDNRLATYVTIDGTDYPLVPGSEVLAVPLNPFSPASQAGNASRAVSQRHAVRVWDDFTAGIGHFDDNEEHGGYAYGTMETRTPGQTTVGPEGPSGGIVSGFTSMVYFPLRVAYLVDSAGNYSFLVWDRGTTPLGAMKAIRDTNIQSIALPATAQVYDVAEYNGLWYILVATAANVYTLYSVTAISAIGGLTLLAPWGGAFAGNLQWLVGFDDKLISYNVGNNVFVQFNGATWVSYINGFTHLFDEQVLQLFVWTDKSGSKDALYALTTKRIIVYDDEGQQWETFYNFSRLWPARNGYCHVNARDNTLVYAPVHLPNSTVATGGRLNDSILAFSPGTVDNWAANKERGLPSDIAFVPREGHLASTPIVLASNIHWLYAFTYAPSVGSVTGIGSQVLARNDQGGWTPVFDAKTGNSPNAYSPIIGGGCGGGRLLVLTADGRYWDLEMPDELVNHPRGDYDTGRTYFLQSGRVYNNQRNVTKLLSHMEVKFQSVPAGTSDIRLKWQTWNGGTVLSGFTSSSNLNVGALLARVDFPPGTAYQYVEWQLTMNMSGTTIPPVVESVALYYTYYQQSHFAYSFTIDLSAETWAKFHPDGTFHGKSRDYLQTLLLNTVDLQQYHSFGYNRHTMRESVAKVDLLLTRREEADNGGGIYPTTARDLEM